MDETQLQRFEALAERDPTNPLLRFTLGTAYAKLGRGDDAATAFRQVLALDPTYSAAYRGLGRALAGAGRLDEARQAFLQGIPVAQQQGDVQTMKELQAFLKKLETGRA